VDGTVVFTSQVDISGNCDISGALRLGSNISLAADPGETEIPGNVTVRWGRTGAINNGATGDVSYATLGFANYTTAYRVYLSVSGNSAYTGCVGQYDVSKKGFSIRNNSGINAAVAWLALGNV
jgi:hypothetical protein